MKSDKVKLNISLSGKIRHILKTVSLWHFVWISIVLAEIFTAIMSIILRGRITVDYLITGGVVSLFVASIIVYLIRHFRFVEETLTNAVLNSEDKYRELADLLPETVFEVDLEGNITFTNRHGLESFGYTPEDLDKGLNVFQMFIPEDVERAKVNIQKRLSGGEFEDHEYTAMRKDGSTFSILVSSSPIIRDDRAVGLRGIVFDISERKKAEEEMRRRLMKFDLQEGNLYGIQESSPLLSIEAFSDLLKAGYRGYVISRMSEDFFKGRLEGVYDFIWLADAEVNGALSTDLDKVLECVEDLSSKAVLLLDSFDHLVFKNGFKKALLFVHSLREKAYLKRLVVVLSVDPDTLEGKELSLLMKDVLEVEPFYRSDLPDDMLEVLGFIYGQNSRGIKPSYADIRRDLGISKPTVLKRMRYLNSAGYVLESMSGNRKSVKLSEKGRSLFLK